MKRNFAKLFAPKSIAIYGVSQETHKIGTTIFTNLNTSDFQGKLYPINPKYEEIFGYKCYPNAQSIPHRVDLAIMAIPAKYTEEVLDDCKSRGIKNLVIISTGYSEIGGKGQAFEDRLIAKAEEYGMNVLGPNCLGLIVPEANMNASFAATDSPLGDVAFMSQSGAMCTATLDMAIERNFGFSHFVSLGNKSVVNENDLLDYWLKSEKTKAIAAYLEDFADGYDFCELVAGSEKPVLVINPGVSDAARKAISSHTGSLAGSTAVIDAALDKYGLIQVEDIDDLMAAMMSFSWGDLPTGDRVGIITNAGGPGILATDLTVASGLQLAQLSDKTKSALAAKLPDTASVGNPVDIIGDAMSDRYQHSLSILTQAEEVDSILLILTPQLVTQIEDTAKLIISMKAKTSKPIYPVFIGGSYVNAGLKRLYDNKILAFSDLSLAIDTLAITTSYAQRSNSKRKRLDIKQFRDERKIKEVAHLSSEDLTPLPEEVTTKLFGSFEISTPKSGIVRDLESAKSLFEQIKSTVVIKATTEDVVRKTEIEAIYLNIANETQLEDRLTKLQGDIYDLTKRDHPPVLMQEQLEAKEEIFIGIKRDGGSDVYKKSGKGFGHLLLFGKGGIYTEVYQDISKALLPLSASEIDDLIHKTKISQIIEGARTGKKLARKKIVDIIDKLQKLVITYPEIAEIDCNPVMVDEKRAVVVDAKIFVSK